MLNKHTKAAIEWLKLAQDKAGDGGVSAYYSVFFGWKPSFIETTGYIIDTLLNCNETLRARKMGDFIISMQNINGSFRSNHINQRPIIFDTGQDILGLTSLYKKTREIKYLNSAIKAANFLCRVQSNNGDWQKYSYGNKSNTYHTRVAWALLKVYQLTENVKYKNAAEKNLKWASLNQLENGWFKGNNFPTPNPVSPYTHTLAYATEGFLYSFLITKKNEHLSIAKKTADAVLNIYSRNNFLPATFDEDWNSRDNYTCLTGDAQFAIIWLNLFKITGEKKYLIFAKKMNNFLKSTQHIKSLNKNVIGAIKGSNPIYGDILRNKGYCRFAYLNWATKFFADSLILEDLILNKQI